MGDGGGGEVRVKRFFHMDSRVFKRCLEWLKRKGKAEVFHLDGGGGDCGKGFKFF